MYNVFTSYTDTHAFAVYSAEVLSPRYNKILFRSIQSVSKILLTSARQLSCILNVCIDVNQRSY